jgi:hypothetical protein
MAFTTNGCSLQSSVALEMRTFDTPFCTANKYKDFMVLVPISKPILSNCYSDKTFWSGTVSVIQHFSPILYIFLVHSNADMGKFYTTFSSPLRAEYFAEVLQMNSLCSTDYSDTSANE